MEKLNSTYSLLTWNTLCNSLCDKSSFPKVDEEYLKWDSRKKLFSSLFSSSASADIYCFQEVDKYDDFKEFLSSDIFESEIHWKESGMMADALFFNKSKFSLLFSTSIKLPQNDQGTISGQHVSTYFIKESLSTTYNKTFMLLVTHLKAKTEFEHVRVAQTKALIKILYENDEILTLAKNYDSKGILLCGDFNAEPTYESIKVILNNENLKSAYNVTDKNQSDFLESSTFKIRNDKSQFRVIDYIFYTPAYIDIKLAYPPIVQKTDERFHEISDKGLPCSFFPSDHLFLKVSFELK